MHKAKKDYLTKLTVREIRLEAKKSAIHLYSRKNKKELVDLILKDRDIDLFRDKTNDEVNPEEERITFDNAKNEEKKITFENANAEEKKIAFENAKAKEEKITFENTKAEEERITFEIAKVEEEPIISFDKNTNLKRILSESFPNKKLSVTDNKDGSQTILIY